MKNKITHLPDINVQTTEGNLNLSSLKGLPVILYFYPKDNTPGCTLEGLDFKNNMAEFQKYHANVLGISKDTLSSHQNFKSKYNLPFSLISDEKSELCDMFQVINKKTLMGKIFKVIERSTFLFDSQGNLYKSWRGIKAKNHVLDVLACLQKCNNLE